MKKFGLTMAFISGMLVAMLQTSLASGHGHKSAPPGPCEPGYEWVEVTVYQEVVRDVCKIVPDIKKTTKWVYSTVADPFCIQKSPHKPGHLSHLLHGHKCDGHCEGGCPTCQGPYCRQQLVKKQVVCEEPTTKCIVEKVVERIPCTTWQKVPCGTVIPTMPTPVMPPATIVPEPIPAPKN